MEGRTSFVIAHRLSTIKNVSLFLVLKDGGIIEVVAMTNCLQRLDSMLSFTAVNLKRRPEIIREEILNNQIFNSTVQVSHFRGVQNNEQTETI